MYSSPVRTEKQRGATPSRTFRLAVIGLLAASVGVVFCALAWLVLNQSIFFAAVPAREAAAPALLSARQAFERAQPAARAWQGDAGLSSVSANWHAARQDDLAGAPPAWVVTFYSPGVGQRQSLVVSSQSVSAWAPERPSGLPPAIDPGRWQVDSRQAMDIFLGDGGREFVLAREPVDVFLTLGLSEAGQLEWTVVALKSATSESYGLYIDAATGTAR